MDAPIEVTTVPLHPSLRGLAPVRYCAAPVSPLEPASIRWPVESITIDFAFAVNESSAVLMVVFMWRPRASVLG
jgi:hypothetical protein